ncbi:carbohydrate kinase family protein [Shinella yambaruensis]|uniref:Sugar kinase n=1 Tax=Shinella yambaruensis TaxID=415996 RepID=A0ABQ5ZD46_9HYPH|nr:carbohydrate kinase family protein [Shinella yambaruensis]MCJ8024238.1 carbohydrate kinase family protein [Shinella yambaruensis]MCU7978613.1 carbohydrate kinase family protein [Shinella yambaruensis]GLR49535.1 sugar kinase [Shinella yambaruensis]
MAGVERRGFITGGTWCLDRNRKIDAWPREDSVGIAWGLEERGGGSACNLAIDVKRLDPTMPVETIGLVGDDDAGRKLIAEADRAGLDCRQMHVSREAPTHTTEAFISQESGQRTHISDLGAGALLTPDHFDFSGTTARVLHLGLPGIHPRMDAPWGTDANGWVSVLRAARAAGLETNLELCTVTPERLRALILPGLPHLDTLIVNDSEIGALAGIATMDGGRANADACAAASATVLERGAMRLVTVHFPEGAITVTRTGERIFVPSASVPPDAIVGPNGAGDAFAAGFLYGLHENWPLADSLWLGHAAAACSLRSAGTTDGVVSWRQCLDTARTWDRRRQPDLTKPQPDSEGTRTW